jgi:ADP-ribosylation factor family
MLQDDGTFMVWDFGGSTHIRELWPFYTSQVLANIVVFVINANECVMRLREAKRTLHWILADPFLRQAELMIVFNKRQKPTKALQDLVFVDNSLNKQQLIELLGLRPKSTGDKYRSEKIERLNGFFSKGVEQAIWEFDVDEEARCHKFFEEIASRIKVKETA